ncbi:MAG: hypothetical protein DWQ34_20435 [Planctomycetota bacterium]|nr:MAG: hypothetical protein DWQ34_20435 [Planctomycetota bacterium]REJ95638.1 MAG: hypothetical protein DWQ29_01695 [Planctomycetota bacterium]REK29777.1 MAG: hypothetical protein DWQ41_03860 [Planctomycetota bacterium]REK30403.1 MAG: hypothetical protein DWQ45_21175 [Planctomycetota bacterium]
MRTLVRQLPIFCGLAAYLIASLGGYGLHLLQHALVDHSCCSTAHAPHTAHAHCHAHHHGHSHNQGDHTPIANGEGRDQQPQTPHDHDNCLICLYQNQAQGVAAPLILPAQREIVAVAPPEQPARPDCAPLRPFHSRAPPAWL